MCIDGEPPLLPDRHYFAIDSDLTYTPFFADFGPLCLGLVYRYCELVQGKLGDAALAGKSLYHVSSPHPHKRANGAFLACAHLVMCCGISPEDAFAPFMVLSPPFIGFRDAAFGLCTYTLAILDCLRGIHKAMAVDMFAFETFDIADYEHVQQLRNGDINWLIPNKFLAFSGPLDEPKPLPTGGHTCGPADYVPYFKAKGVTCVVRLNKPHYDRTVFTAAGIKHVDMYYPDGSVPPPETLQQFLTLCEQEPGAIGVHCKAGLGRTGTCIGAYVMKHWGFTAREVIAWFRVCRPGSVLGAQQHYMESIQDAMWAAGAAFRASASSRRGRVKSAAPGRLAAAGAGELHSVPSPPTSPSSTRHASANPRIAASRNPRLAGKA